jgi:hypothetical protein
MQIRKMTAAHFHQFTQQQQQQHLHHQQQQQQQQRQQQQWQFQQSMSYQPTVQTRQHGHQASQILQKSRSGFNLTQIKEFPYDRSLSDPPYQEHLFLLENIVVKGYNVRPHDKRELFVPLPELVRQLFQSKFFNIFTEFKSPFLILLLLVSAVSLEAMHSVLSQLNISQYRGNRSVIDHFEKKHRK